MYLISLARIWIGGFSGVSWCASLNWLTHALMQCMHSGSAWRYRTEALCNPSSRNYTYGNCEGSLAYIKRRRCYVKYSHHYSAACLAFLFGIQDHSLVQRFSWRLLLSSGTWLARLHDGRKNWHPSHRLCWKMKNLFRFFLKKVAIQGMGNGCNLDILSTLWPCV